MRLILTNDDGIDAPGLAALVCLAAEFGDPLVVAPDTGHSDLGHRVTTMSPIRVQEIRPGWQSISGTPADCSRLALTCLAPDAAWVLSGINRGGNLGADTYMSGTVAAAREATLLGRSAIAVSHYIAKGREPDWGLAAARLRPVLRDLLGRGVPPGCLWNVNLPHPPHVTLECPVTHCDLDASPHDVRYTYADGAYRYAGQYQQRPRQPGHDVAHCFAGHITVTAVMVRPSGDLHPAGTPPLL